MFKTLQLTTGSLFLATTVIALLLNSTMWAALATIELVTIWAIVKTLSCNLPSGILVRIKKNCMRAVGTYSSGRASIERLAIRHFEKNLYLALILILIPTNILIWFLFDGGSIFQTDELLSDAENQQRIESRAFTLAISFGIYMTLAMGILGSAYWHSLRELNRSVQMRAREYWLRDLRTFGDEFDYQSRPEGVEPEFEAKFAKANHEANSGKLKMHRS